MTKRIITILVLVLSLSLFASAAEISSADDMLTLMNTPSMWADSYTLTTDIDLGDAVALDVIEKGVDQFCAIGCIQGHTRKTQKVHRKAFLINSLAQRFIFGKRRRPIKQLLRAIDQLVGDIEGIGVLIDPQGRTFTRCHNQHKVLCDRVARLLAVDRFTKASDLTVNVNVRIPQQSADDIGFQIVASAPAAIGEVALLQDPLDAKLFEELQILLQRVQMQEGLQVVAEIHGVIPHVKPLGV